MSSNLPFDNLCFTYLPSFKSVLLLLLFPLPLCFFLSIGLISKDFTLKILPISSKDSLLNFSFSFKLFSSSLSSCLSSKFSYSSSFVGSLELLGSLVLSLGLLSSFESFSLLFSSLFVISSGFSLILCGSAISDASFISSIVICFLLLKAAKAFAVSTITISALFPAQFALLEISPAKFITLSDTLTCFKISLAFKILFAIFCVSSFHIFIYPIGFCSYLNLLFMISFLCDTSKTP